MAGDTAATKWVKPFPGSAMKVGSDTDPNFLGRVPSGGGPESLGDKNSTVVPTCSQVLTSNPDQWGLLIC